MGGANTNSCFYVEHQTPVLTHVDFAVRDPEDFNRGDGRIWTLQASLGRELVDFTDRSTARVSSPRPPSGGSSSTSPNSGM